MAAVRVHQPWIPSAKRSCVCTIHKTSAGDHKGSASSLAEVEMTAGSSTLCWAGDDKMSCPAVKAVPFGCRAVLLQQTAVASAQLP